VGELIDERHLRTAGDDGIGVHLLESAAAILDNLARNDHEISDHLGGEGAIVRLDEPDDYIGAAFVPAPAFVQHGAGLSHAGGGAEIDAEASSRLDVAGVDEVGLLCVALSSGDVVWHRPILPFR
jgi:hypothetical protein